MKRDSIANTFVVAGGLCIVCSLLVSLAAVGLGGWQDRNVELDKKRNILLAAGLIEEKASAKEVEDTFSSRIRDTIFDFEKGQLLSESQIEERFGSVAEFDQLKASKAPGQHVKLNSEDIAGIKRRENHGHIYQVLSESGEVEAYVFPVRGYGLWSTLYGFLALDSDLETILGLTFYAHGETPGLGGEVENKKWKAGWVGKKLYGEPGDDGELKVQIKVVKGIAEDEFYEVDGLSGATITSDGVTYLLQYWMGPDAYGKFVANSRDAANDDDTNNDDADDNDADNDDTGNNDSENASVRPLKHDASSPWIARGGSEFGTPHHSSKMTSTQPVPHESFDSGIVGGSHG